MHQEMARIRLLLLLPLVAAAVLASPASADRSSAIRQKALDKQLLVQVNSLRAQHGLRPLRLAHGLSAAATRHSLQMAERGYFSHSSADGTAFWKRIQRLYPAKGFRRWTVGENLIWEAPELSATEALRLWMASSPHRANLLSRTWREIGISVVASPVAPGVYRGQTVMIATVDFGARR
jgi:uncharacterized protein YkwD